MATEAASKAKRETWQDWRPEDGDLSPSDLLTRDQLIQRLTDKGIRVSVDDIRNWQGAGLIPYGIRRRHKGATRTLYPPWMVGLIRLLRAAQGTGMRLSDPNMPRILRANAGQAVPEGPLLFGTAHG